MILTKRRLVELEHETQLFITKEREDIRINILKETDQERDELRDRLDDIAQEKEDIKSISFYYLFIINN